MTTSLIIEDGTQVAAANSYITVEELKAYWATRGNPDNIKNTDECDLETALIQAGEYLDLNYRRNFVGCKISKEQGLYFPVEKGFYNDGFIIDQDEIPQELKDAQAEMANLAVDENLFNDNSKQSAPVTKSKKKVGPIEKSEEFTSSGSTSNKSYPQIDSILENILFGIGVFNAVRI